MKSFTSVLATGLGVAGAVSVQSQSKPMDLAEATRRIQENVAGIQQTYGEGGQSLCDKYTCCEYVN